MTTSRVFILPTGDTASRYTILTLPHPQSAQPTRYLLHPSSKGLLYEIIKVPNSSAFPRSWLFTKNRPLSSDTEEQVILDTEQNGDSIQASSIVQKAENGQIEEKMESLKDGGTKERTGDRDTGQVIQEAHLYMTSPMDPLYLLLPQLISKQIARNFLPLDDILETHPQSSTWNRIIKASNEAETYIYERIKTVCDTVDTEGEVVYRINEEMVMAILQKRVEAMADNLPKSIQVYVDRQLARPLGIQPTTIEAPKVVNDTQPNGGVIDDAKLEDEVREETGEGVSETMTTRNDSQTNENNKSEDVSQSVSEPEAMQSMQESTTAAAVVTPPPAEVLKLSCVSHALQLLGPYLSIDLHQRLTAHMNQRYAPEPLDSYLLELKIIREAAAAAIESSMMHAKRTFEDIEGGVRSKEESEREKKRKKKEEEARKSQGVKKLEKVNTRGMSKMTAFFKKKE